MNKNRDDSIQTETESGSEVPGLVPSGPVNIFQPKLLRLGKFTHTQLNLDEMHKKQSKAIKKKIKEIIKIEKKMQQEERNNYNSSKAFDINFLLGMKEALISFYKNPFKYMDYLIEKYCNILMII